MIKGSDVQQYDVAFVPQPVQEDWPEGAIDIFPENCHTLPQALDRVDCSCRKHQHRRAIMIPCGYEDEGVFFRDWTAQEGYPEVLEVRFIPEFDFADLRGWES